MIARGVTQVFPESGHYLVPETIQLMNRWPDCIIFLAPTMVKRLIEHPEVGELRPGALRLITYGGAPMYVSDLKRGLDTLGAALGSSVAAFLLLPALGMERALFALLAAYGVVGIVASAGSGGARITRWVEPLAFAAITSKVVPD